MFPGDTVSLVTRQSNIRLRLVEPCTQIPEVYRSARKARQPDNLRDSV